MVVPQLVQHLLIHNLNILYQLGIGSDRYMTISYIPALQRLLHKMAIILFHQLAPLMFIGRI
ncbi:hypothetical protein D3C85_1789810 [compost metagenome]